MRLNDIGHGRLDAPKLAPSDIIVRKGYNYRDITTPEAQAHIAWLEENIRENGVQEPIRVEFSDGKAYLVNGECRLEAVKRLWKKGLEVYIPALQEKGDEADVLASSMIANGSLPPSQLEFGKAAARLRDYGWDDERIAKLTPPHISQDAHRAARYVRDAVDLHQAPIEVKKAVQEGVDGVKISPALAVQAVRKNPLQAAEIVKEEAKKAKAAGKKVAMRPKGEGKAAKAKKATAQATGSLIELGDKLAAAVLNEDVSYDALRKLANRWQKARE